MTGTILKTPEDVLRERLDTLETNLMSTAKALVELEKQMTHIAGALVAIVETVKAEDQIKRDQVG
jgi:hypothetical protein